MKHNKLTCLLLLFSLTIFGQKAKPSLKTIICKYDSAITISFADMSSVYFTAESNKKVYEFIKPDIKTERKIYNKFWNETPIKTDTISGNENHTKSGNIGVTFEITYTTETVEMEGGMGNVNIIKDFEVYDSIYILKKETLAKWKTQDKKIDLKNVAPNNPASISKKFMNACNNGDFKTMTALSVNSEQAASLEKEGQCSANKIVKTLERIDKKIIQKNSAEGAKIELAKTMLSEMPLEQQLKTPVTHYLSETIAVVAIWKKGEHIAYLTMVKLGASWKIISSDDRIPCQKAKEETMLTEVFLLKIKETNPSLK
jgi:hypothetical protein